jgi:hypothetical protein
MFVRLGGRGYLDELQLVLQESYDDVPQKDALRRCLKRHRSLFVTEPGTRQVRVRGGHADDTWDYTVKSVAQIAIESCCAAWNAVLIHQANEPRGRPPGVSQSCTAVSASSPSQPTAVAWCGDAVPSPWPWSELVHRPVDAVRVIRDRVWRVPSARQIYSLVADGRLGPLPIMPCSLVTQLLRHHGIE